MICPRCQTQVSDDAVICDSCSFIIDPTFLGENITNDGSGRSPDATPAGDRTRIRAVNVDAPAPVDVPEPTLEARDGGGGLVSGRGVLTRVAAPPAGLNETVDELRDTFRSFPLSEQFTTGSAVVFLISLGLPWRWSEADDYVIGLFAGAWPLGILASLVAAAAYLRRDAAFSRYSPEILWSVLAGAFTMCAYAIIYIRSVHVEATVYMAGKMPIQQAKSVPHIGAFLGLVAAIVMLVASAVTLFNRSSLERSPA